MPATRRDRANLRKIAPPRSTFLAHAGARCRRGANQRIDLLVQRRDRIIDAIALAHRALDHGASFAEAREARDHQRGAHAGLGLRQAAARGALDEHSRKFDARSPKPPVRSEEHTSELQSLMRTSYAVFCLQKKITTQTP